VCIIVSLQGKRKEWPLFYGIVRWGLLSAYEQLNKKVLGLLIKELGIYPPGSIVQLSNAKYALVMGVCKEAILKPNVMLYDPSIPKSDAAIISLKKEKELKIEKVIVANKLPENIREYLNPRARVNYYFEYND
jgi:hypothetical protein